MEVADVELKLGKSIKRSYTLNHKGRAVKYDRLSDGEQSEYFKYALEYFDYRCAFSGERFVTYNDEKNRRHKDNLSADHIIALAMGGHDIYPNLVPCILQYNTNKNKKYLLDFLFSQKDTEGNIIYSPYRMVKLINYIVKSIEARNDEMTPEEYGQYLLSTDLISLYLKNAEEKIYSNIITDTEELTKESSIESLNGIKFNIEMSTLLSDILELLKKEPKIDKNIIEKLEVRAQNAVKGFEQETEIRNQVINILNDLKLSNTYTVAFFLTQDLKTKMIENESDFDKYIEQQIKNRIELLSRIGI